PSHDTTGLVVANLVDENSEVLNALPRAQSVDLEAANRRAQRTKQSCTYILLGLVILIAVIIILVTVLVPSGGESSNDEEDTPTSMPSSNPSEAPTTLDQYYLSLLPEDTQQKIMEDVQSLQSLAFQWLLDDMIELDDDYSNNNSSVFMNRIKQRFALATIYYATGGNIWAHNDNWLNHTVHECEWFTRSEFALKSKIAFLYTGFLQEFQLPTSKCDTHTGIYEHLWLDQNNLVGSLPEELYMLTTLKTLSMGFNMLVGPLSTLLGQMTALQGLAFANSDHGGTIPSEFGLLTALTILGLPGINLQGSIPTEVWQLTNLSSFFLNFNDGLRGSIPTEIGVFSQLRWLSLTVCDLSGTLPSEIGLAKALDTLTLEENRISGTIVSEIGILEEMRILSLFNNSLEGTLPTELGLLTQTTLLTFRDNLLTGPVPQELGLLTNLRISLVLRGNQLSGQIPSELGLLANLREISLENNNFSGQIPSQLGQLSQALHSLKLGGNPMLTGTISPGVCKINGTCIQNSFDPCEEPYGVLLDCTDKLCGCGCSCATRT
ncbi:Leucine Rich Repeat (Partial), partial [Seminavis robusta]